MLKKLAAASFILILAFTAACSGENNDETIGDDVTVAKVNDMEVKGEEYNYLYEQFEQFYTQQGQDPEDEETAKMIKESVLEQLIGQTVIIYYAEQNGFGASDEEVEKELNSVKEQYEDEEEFAQILKEYDITEDELREEIALQIKTEKYIEHEIGPIQVTDDEVQEFYESYKEQMGDELPELDEIKDVLRGELERKKQQEKVAELIEELKEQSEIDIFI
ncbi:MAG: SurA N-terminal domain-containing protein [Bacillaceae bacterium]|nr:SurA N-terminal domain-containing protein [Bacillaceae bacterium]